MSNETANIVSVIERIVKCDLQWQKQQKQTKI